MACKDCTYDGLCMLNYNELLEEHEDNPNCKHFKAKVERHEIEVRTIEEVTAQIQMLLANGYLVAVLRDNNMFGDCIKYRIVYQKLEVADQ